MNNISEQLLQAMEIIAQEKLKQLQYDKTIQATIYSIVDADTGEYKVRYNGNIFSAFSEDTSKSYSVDDIIYVKVPEGNFSNKKLITSLVTAKSLSSAQISDLTNSVFEVSPTFDALYGNAYDASESYGVIAGVPAGEIGSSVYIFQNDEEYNPNGYHGLFQQYANNYEYIRVKASFLTQFHNVHSKGNYGIEVEFYTKDNSSVSYRLDLQNFNGNPYGFSVYSPQSIILKAQKNYLMGLKSIKLFEEDFIYDKIVKNGIVTDEENTTVANIFVKDISLQYVDLQDLSDTSYYLTISAPKGIAFTDKVPTLELIGRLIYNGDDIMDSKNCVCQWYERDLSVVIGSDKYVKAAGFGWKKMDKQTSDTLTLDATDVLYQQRYKLVVVYNNNVTLTAEIAVWNRNSNYDYSIVQVTDGADIKLQIKNNYDDESLVGDWYLSYPDDSYSSVPEGEKQSEIVVSSYLQYSSVIFYCMVYNSSGEYIGTLEHTIVNSESEDDVTISYIGEDSFRYDANGDISIEDAEKERALQVNLAWKEGFGTSYFVSWLMKDAENKEHEIPTSKSKAYNPDNSMLENIWVDNYNILHYNIKQKYRVNFSNNTIIVKIRTIAESTYLFNKEILCLKDGDQGTNGTTYITAIRPCNSEGVKLSGLQPLRYNNSWQNTLQVRCYVYKDGELINGNNKYSITYKWEGINVFVQDREILTDTTDQVIVRGKDPISESSPSAQLAFYVKVQVTIKDANSSVDIYASYPVDVILGTASVDDINIDSIPSYIKYNSAGLTPSFYSNDINFYYKNNIYNDNIVSLNTNILSIVTSNGKKYLEPASNFIFESIKDDLQSNIGVLSFAIPNSSDRLIHPIVMYLDTYGNEAINGWDGTALDTGDGEYVFAPQVGAGTKDSQNRFTGVVMGKDSGQKDKLGNALIGLYGYQDGKNTFGLRADGTAFFGLGEIIKIDGPNAKITGGKGGNDANGMTITLANLESAPTGEAIKLGGGVFQVNYDGALLATSATIEGTIYATTGRIGCSSRNSEDGWIIKKNRLYSSSSGRYVELNSDKDTDGAIWTGSSSYESAKSTYFAVSKKGQLYAKTGNIGGWTLTRNSLYADTVGLSSTGNAAFWAGSDVDAGSTSIKDTSAANFLVTHTGRLYCTSADISGRIKADSGTIGGWTINDKYLTGGGTILNSDGSITCGNLVATGGSIGGWTIQSNALVSRGGGLSLNGDTGTISNRYGYFGGITGSSGAGNTTYNIGIAATGGSGSVVLQAQDGNGNIKLDAANSIYLLATSIILNGSGNSVISAGGTISITSVGNMTLNAKNGIFKVEGSTIDFSSVPSQKGIRATFG